MATDEEVNEARDRVESLRVQIANNEYDRATRERELANEITLAELKAEEARLEAELAQQEKTHSEEAIRQGAQSPLAAAEAALERSKTQKAAAESPVPSESETAEPTPPAPASPVAPVAPVAPTVTKTNEKGGK